MTEKINWTLNVQVVGGPKVSASQSTEVQAYGKIEVDIPEASGPSAPGTATVKVQPSAGEKVKFVLITASAYDADLTYSVTGGVSDIPLDAPQLLVGGGAVGLLGSAPNEFKFSNPAGGAVSVEILVGRDATTETATAPQSGNR